MHGLTQLNSYGFDELPYSGIPSQDSIHADRITAMPVASHQHALSELERNAPVHKGIQDQLGKVITSAVATPGGLFRFDLASRMAQAFGGSNADANALGCAVEYFHIASLLLDDLPQMDDSMERRGRICPHLLYGEEMVILGSLGLITRAYALLGGVICGAPPERHRAAHALVESCLGTTGILNGQARDLKFAKEGGSRREVVSISAGKTAPLIHLAMGLPALLFGADRRALTLLARLSLFWGLFYQGLDDLKDLLEKSAESGKTPGRDQALGRPNMALAVGEEKAKAYLLRLDRLSSRCIGELIQGHSRFSFLSEYHRMLAVRWEALVSQR